MNTCYPEQILILCDVPLTHTEANGYECEDPDCICHWEHRTQEQDAPRGTLHTASSYQDCSCQRCTYVRETLSGGGDA